MTGARESVNGVKCDRHQCVELKLAVTVSDNDSTDAKSIPDEKGASQFKGMSARYYLSTDTTLGTTRFKINEETRRGTRRNGRLTR